MDQKYLEDNVPGYRELMLRFRVSGDGLLFGPIPPPMDPSVSPSDPEPDSPPAINPELAIDAHLAAALAALAGDAIH